MKTRTTYRIVEEKDGTLHTLFHGKGGSRALEPGVWLEADERTVRDGTGNNWYRSGWHTLPTLDDARAYLQRFRKRRERLRLVECEVSDCWGKDHSPAPVILSRYLRIVQVVN